MRILVSGCLLGECCKYNGGSNRNELLLQKLAGHTVISVCPECLGGLPTPRHPSEIVDGVVTNDQGICVDAEFRRGAAIALQTAIREGAELAILQSRSPSCGAKEIYDGSFSRRKIPGMGIFARMVKEAGIPILDIEDLTEDVIFL